MFHSVEYGIFWNMEYFGIWNILKILNILKNGIFLNMDYLENGINTEHFDISQKPYLSYFCI